MIEKLKPEDVKPSSRQYPYIRLQIDPKEKLHRLAVEVEGLSKGYDKNLLFKNLNLSIEAGEKVAIIGPNGIGKTTLLRCIAKDIEVIAGTVKWAEKARPGYWPQDPADEFKTDDTLAEWLGRWRRKDRPEQDDLIVRATLGQLLFSGDDQKKSFVSHDREFVSSLATRILELRPGAKPGDPAVVVDFHGNYEDFLAESGAERAAA
jgi:ATPase subunit of ABC transporter with duplicated ATPase domains